ncbi:conserved hypothetical protein [Roseibium sp. TrichSKD4]|uniref:hypothetical protein n=1 Tax=Roseibium sp. TrichSKD4 TaxID=744980 RepID=UPI0001E575A4|nr:hypothetical protein [Roseibium sp. TrichSKD4]EFO30911.1 conserved hypothetical protein [Roseibium sp. TrichSKD4]
MHSFELPNGDRRTVDTLEVLGGNKYRTANLKGEPVVIDPADPESPYFGAMYLPDGFPPEPEPAPTEADIRTSADARALALAGQYSDAERETCPVQIAEAEALAANPEAYTPFLNMRAEKRGMDAASLAEIVRQRQSAYAAAMGAIYGAMNQILANPPATVLEMEADPRWPTFPTT